jgi:hypothetical protein
MRGGTLILREKVLIPLDILLCGGHYNTEATKGKSAD